jgi:uncharacterized protein (TIGR00297 family)
VRNPIRVSFLRKSFSSKDKALDFQRKNDYIQPYRFPWSLPFMNIIRFFFEAPSQDWLRFVYFVFGLFGFIALAEWTRAKLGWSPEVNRKLVHILVGTLVFFTPFFFTSNRPLIWMAVLFILINYLSVRADKLKGMHGTERTSYGTVFYPLTFLILTITCWQNHKIVLMLAMLILALPDALAAIAGENIKRPHVYQLTSEKKSVEGSLILFLSTFVIIALLLPLIDHIDGFTISFPDTLWIALIVSIIVIPLEALSSRGSDNLSAPLGAAFIIHYMITHTVQDNLQLSIGTGLALIVALASYRIRFLSASGSAGTFVLAACIFGIGGWSWAIPMLFFFILSSILSKIGKTYKAQFELVFEKTSQRDIAQVMANGGLAGCMIIFYAFYTAAIWYYLYLGAIAAVNADTWATEIGIFSKIQPRLIANFKQVPHGTSGGITGLGLFSTLIGSISISLIGSLVAPAEFHYSFFGTIFWIITLGGFVASLIDSLLGATIQAQYRCPVCRKITEKKRHCKGNQTQPFSGLSWLNNDWVNGICSASSVLFVYIVTMLFMSD